MARRSKPKRSTQKHKSRKRPRAWHRACLKSVNQIAEELGIVVEQREALVAAKLSEAEACLGREVNRMNERDAENLVDLDNYAADVLEIVKKMKTLVDDMNRVPYEVGVAVSTIESEAKKITAYADKWFSNAEV